MWTLQRILEIIEETKDLKRDDQTKVALSMPIFACSLYVAHMKRLYQISIPI